MCYSVTLVTLTLVKKKPPHLCEGFFVIMAAKAGEQVRRSAFASTFSSMALNSGKRLGATSVRSIVYLFVFV